MTEVTEVAEVNGLREILFNEAIALLDKPAVLSTLGIALATFTLVWCQIFAKAGFRAHSGLLMLVPGLNVLVFVFVAFYPWPLRRELHLLKKMEKQIHSADQRHQKRIKAA